MYCCFDRIVMSTQPSSSHLYRPSPFGYTTVAANNGTMKARVSNQTIAMRTLTAFLVKITRIGKIIARLLSRLTQTKVKIEHAMEPAWAE